MRSLGIADDLAHGVCLFKSSVYKLVRDADFKQTSMQHQSANRPPALRAWMRPQKQAFAAGTVVANGAHQMRRPNPGSGKQDDRIDSIVAFHLLECGPGFFFAGNDDTMLNNLQTCRNQRTLGAPNQCLINEWRAHWVLQTIFMNSKNYESDCGLNHCSSKLASCALSVCPRSARRAQKMVLAGLSCVRRRDCIIR